MSHVWTRDRLAPDDVEALFQGIDPRPVVEGPPIDYPGPRPRCEVCGWLVPSVVQSAFKVEGSYRYLSVGDCCVEELTPWGVS